MNERKIISYKTMWAYGRTIDEDINDEIQSGWQPIGGISHLHDEENEYYSYCQAMVKYEES